MSGVTDRAVRVLFLCTGNSCRSQMAEAILRHVGAGRFKVCSAGSHPAGFIHPLAAAALNAMQIPLTGQRSKSWDEYADAHFDLVITLCDEAAQEPCPRFPEMPLHVHWSTPDPAYAPGSDEERLAFAITTGQRLRTKLEGLMNVDFTRAVEQVKNQLEFLAEI